MLRGLHGWCYCTKPQQGRQGAAGLNLAPLCDRPPPCDNHFTPCSFPPGDPAMPHRPSRRCFLQSTAALTASAALAAAQPRPAPADRIRLGIIGVAGQGGYNLSNVRQEEIVALCDVDEERAAPVRK